MLKVTNLIGFGGKRSNPAHVEYKTGATSTAQTIPWPSVASGDLAVLFDYSYGFIMPTSVTPTNFTNVLDSSASTTKFMVSYKICNGTESGNITGMASSGTGVSKILLIFSGDYEEAHPVDWVGEVTTGDPSQQTAGAAKVGVPCIAFGLLGDDGAPAAFSVESPAFDAEHTSGNLRVGHKIYNPGSEPQDHAVDAADNGTRNALGTGVIGGLYLNKSVPGYSQPTIVTDGLQMYLDAGVRASHTGRSDTWYDLTGNGFNADVSDQGFTTDGRGGIVFPAGGSTAADIPSGLNFSNGGFTISVWLKHTGVVSTARVQRYFTLNRSATEGPVLRHNASSAASLHAYTFNDSSVNQSIDVASMVFNNAYYNFVYTYDGTTFKLYRNNSEVGSLTSSITYTNPTTTGLSSASEYFEGHMFAVMYYNKALGTTDLTTNYNAFKDRFGL